MCWILHWKRKKNKQTSKLPGTKEEVKKKGMKRKLSMLLVVSVLMTMTNLQLQPVQADLQLRPLLLLP